MLLSAFAAEVHLCLAGLCYFSNCLILVSLWYCWGAGLPSPSPCEQRAAWVLTQAWEEEWGASWAACGWEECVSSAVSRC